jgi:lipoate-protein ligase B
MIHLAEQFLSFLRSCALGAFRVVAAHCFSSYKDFSGNWKTLTKVPSSMRFIDLGLCDYLACLELQQKLVDEVRAGNETDLVLLLEHPPTITLGMRGSLSDVTMPPESLSAKGIALYRVDRGGQATFHGPGQLIAYPIVDLRRLRLTVREYVFRLEETIIRVLAHFGVTAHRQSDKVGIWIGPQDKIASIGVRVRNRVTYHGFSLNVGLAHDPSQFVVCCGMPDARMVSLNDLVHPPISMDVVKLAVGRAIEEALCP